LNVLLVRAGALGDVVLLRTAVAALRAAGHSVSLLAPSAPGAALRGHGPCDVDSVLPWESATFAGLLADDANIHSELRDGLAPFHVVIAYTSSEDLVRGLARVAPSAQIVAQAPLPPPSGPHAADWAAQAVTPFAADPAGAPPIFVASETETRQARPWLDRLGPGFLAVHPGSGAARKNWPAQRFASLVERVTAGRPFLLVEGPADVATAASLAAVTSVVRARDLPPRVLGAVLARAALYVGNDSGVSHLAAAWGAPVLALFGPTDPGQWAPVGPRVKVLRAADGRMESLELQDVVQTARRMLGSTTSTKTDRQV
jgi:ADP-heptose:LPS heptosyltransferase